MSAGKVLTSKSPEETGRIAAEIMKICENRRIFAIYGEMGAGKTTLVKGFCELLGVIDSAKSPTFSIVNEYAGKNGPVYHFDFYRIRDEEEAYDIGFEEYIDSGNWCFIEWPEMIAGLLPEDCAKISVVSETNNERTIKIDCQ